MASSTEHRDMLEPVSPRTGKRMKRRSKRFFILQVLQEITKSSTSDQTFSMLERVRLQCPSVPVGHQDGHSVVLGPP